MLPSNFAAFVLSHGRPDNILTIDTLRRAGYTGRIVILVDDMDPTRGDYELRYGSMVYVFDKKAAGTLFDRGDNFENYRSTNYARNASFEIARKIGVESFIQLDDDYRHFQFRFDREFVYHPRVCKDLDSVFAALLKFYRSTNIASIAISQGGDFIGGENSPNARNVLAKRKAMNSFLCSVDRPFEFLGRLNEDVNTYVRHAGSGLVFLTTNQISLEQVQTQANSGGMTEAYLEGGTYVKSFYTVMYHPSGARVKVLRDRENSRLHHAVLWNNTAPKILRESVKKT